MQFEEKTKSYKSEIVIGLSIFVILVIGLIIKLTFAKYSLVKNIKVTEEDINYKLLGSKMLAMYKNDGNDDIEIDTMPESGYEINETKSYCTLDNINKDSNAKLYTDENGKHVISGLSKTSKCYLYFDKIRTKKVKTALGTIEVNLDTPDFNITSCVAGTNNGSNCGEAYSGIYQANDSDGISYYFRGGVTNNYVKFANLWWRIIRINGDGSIRLIFDGISANANGTNTPDSIALKKQNFNVKQNDNMYVGFKYTSGEVHGLGTKSNALSGLETWYTSALSNYTNKIDTNAGFCGDRTPSTSTDSSNGSGGTGRTITYYGAYFRLENSKISPILTCENESDLYTVSSSTKGNKSLTYPIGLISADEVSMAGGRIGTVNYGYYLYNGQHYWTMSPYLFRSSAASMYGVSSNGQLYNWLADVTIGLRPVINLKADLTFTGNGTMSEPYIVS